MFVPDCIKNAKYAGKTNAENPGEVPHDLFSIEIDGVLLDEVLGYPAAKHAECDGGVNQDDRQENQRHEQHHKQSEPAG